MKFMFKFFSMAVILASPILCISQALTTGIWKIKSSSIVLNEDSTNVFIINGSKNVLDLSKISYRFLEKNIYSGTTKEGATFKGNWSLLTNQITLDSVKSNFQSISDSEFIISSPFHLRDTLGNSVLATSVLTFINLLTTLPIKLQNFTVKLQNKTTQINWQTSAELNTKSFSIQRSITSREFTSIGTLLPKGGIRNYSYNDNQPMNGYNYYRLLIKENDGSTSYSEIRAVFVSSNPLTRIYPNPVKDNLTIEINSETPVNAQIIITTIIGKTLQIFNTQLQAGFNKTNIHVGALVSGSYLLRINTNNNNVMQVMKFIKQ